MVHLLRSTREAVRVLDGRADRGGSLFRLRFRILRRDHPSKEGDDVKTPLHWTFGDRATWRRSPLETMPCEVEYVADDGILISYRRREEGKLRFAIVAPRDLDLRLRS